MEWREWDTDGNCVVCKHKIKPGVKKPEPTTEVYKIDYEAMEPVEEVTEPEEGGEVVF